MGTTKQTSGARAVAGRPAGSLKTEHNDLVARIRAARFPLTQQQFARELGIGLSTLRKYEHQKMIPTEGIIRTAIENAAKAAGVSITEKVN